MQTKKTQKKTYNQQAHLTMIGKAKSQLDAA